MLQIPAGISYSGHRREAIINHLSADMIRLKYILFTFEAENTL